MKKKKVAQKPVRPVNVTIKSKAPVVIIPNAKLFMDLLGIYAKQITESQVKYENGEMVFRAMDPANVSMLTLTLKKGFFRKNNLKGVDFLNVSEGKGGSEKELLGLGGWSKQVQEGDVLAIEQYKNFYTLTLFPKAGARKTGKLNLIDQKDMKEVKRPPLDNIHAVINLPPDLFSEIVLNAEKALVSVKIEVEKDKLSFSAEGDISTYNEEVDGAEVKRKAVEGKIADSTSSKFSVEYLKAIAVKAAKVFKNGTLELELGTDYPLIIHYREANVELEMILAPRVDND